MKVTPCIDECLVHAACACMILVLGIMLPSRALGHKVNVFAYADAGNVYTESYFNDGSPCRDSLIQVYDSAGTELLAGKTDDKGVFSFAIPTRTDLRIVLTASMGHRAEYRLPAAELPGTATSGAEGDVPSGATDTANTAESVDQNGKDVSEDLPTTITLDTIRSVVEDAVERSIERRMTPLVHSMMRSRTSRVPLTDIIGGIGYIFGVMGLILYFKKREK
ncbi:MAG: hypothetical protein ACMUIS_12885 [bacterium]